MSPAAGLPDGEQLAARLRDGDLSAAPAVLNLVENRGPAATDAILDLLRGVAPDRLGGEARGHLIGITGPPGVGKSTLLSRLVREWRSRDRSVAVLAVDPSSRRSGGSLLGDRARIAFDPHDPATFIRSTAAGDRLGGLAPATRTAAHALATAFDVVVIETVGVGQSETEISEVADTVAVIVQPGSGDALQFLKSGIMEIPDVLVVTKADLGDIALRARRDLGAALRSAGSRETAVVAVSSVTTPPIGMRELVDALDRHRERIDLPERRLASRRASALADFVNEHGERGVRALGGRRTARGLLEQRPRGEDIPTLVRALEEHAAADGASDSVV